MEECLGGHGGVREYRQLRVRGQPAVIEGDPLAGEEDPLRRHEDAIEDRERLDLHVAAADRALERAAVGRRQRAADHLQALRRERDGEGDGTWLWEIHNQRKAGSFNASSQENPGWGVALGYDLAEAYPTIGPGRRELEAPSRRVPVKNLGFAEATLPASGNVTIKSLMVNTIGEYHNETIWVPYVILGAGYADVSVSQVNAEGAAFIASSSSGVFAYQVGAGLGLELSGHLTLDIGYRYFATLEPELKLADGSKFKSEIASHNLLVGLRLKY